LLIFQKLLKAIKQNFAHELLSSNAAKFCFNTNNIDKIMLL